MSLLKFVKSDNTNKAMECLQGTPNLLEVNESDGRTVFHYVIENTNIELLTALLVKFSESSEFYNLNIEDHFGHTPLILAIHNNFMHGFDEILKFKIDVNYKTKNGRTALHYSAESYNRQFLEKLINKEGKINANCSEGSCLHVALKNSQVENALILLEEKDISLLEIDSNGDTPFHTVIKEGIPDVFVRISQILEKLKDNDNNLVKQILNAKNSLGNTVLHEAVLKKRSNLLQILRQKFVNSLLLDEKIRNKDGRTGNEIQKLLEEEEENQRLAAIEKKKTGVIKNREKQEQKKKEMIELEQKMKEEEESKKKVKENATQVQETQSKMGMVYTGVVLVCVLFLMYLALNYLEQKKRDNYID